MNLIQSNIFLKGLELEVYLGWPPAERSALQRIIIDFKIYFPEPPLACTTDNLDDTFCYDVLIDAIKQHVANREFHLLEYLGREIYQVMNKLLNARATISVWVRKKHPFENIKDITFFYGDNNQVEE